MEAETGEMSPDLPGDEDKQTGRRVKRSTDDDDGIHLYLCPVNQIDSLRRGETDELIVDHHRTASSTRTVPCLRGQRRGGASCCRLLVLSVSCVMGHSLIGN